MENTTLTEQEKLQLADLVEKQKAIRANEVKEFQVKLDALCKEYNVELLPILNIKVL